MFDEPTSALNPETVGDVLRVILWLAKEEMTLAIAIHEMEFVRELEDEVVVLNEGGIV